MKSTQLTPYAMIALTLLALPAMASDTISGAKAKIGEGKAPVCLRKDQCGKKLSLSNDQLLKLSKLNEEVINSSASDIAQLKTLRIELMQALSKPVVNRDEAMSIQSKMNGIRAELANKFLAYRIDKMSLLTQEQKDKLDHKLLERSAFSARRHKEFGRRAKLS